MRFLIPGALSQDTEPQYLRAAEVAALLGVSPKTVARYAKEGKLPYMRTLGGHRRYPAEPINVLAEELQGRPYDATKK